MSLLFEILITAFFCSLNGIIFILEEREEETENQIFSNWAHNFERIMTKGIFI